MSQKNLSPQEVSDMLKAGSIVLIDVREPNEYAAEHIEGATLFPLSCFEPCKLPDTGGKPIVFQCAGGVRSAKAINACLNEKLAHNAHMAGGLRAWKDAGLPIVKG